MIWFSLAFKNLIRRKTRSILTVLGVAILTRQGGELPKEGDEPVFSQVVAQDGLPFEVKAPNAATLAAMEEADQGNLPRFGSVQELFDELEKDGEEYRR